MPGGSVRKLSSRWRIGETKVKHPYLATADFIVGGGFCGFITNCLIHHLWAAAVLASFSAFVFIGAGLAEAFRKDKEL